MEVISLSCTLLGIALSVLLLTSVSIQANASVSAYGGHLEMAYAGRASSVVLEDLPDPPGCVDLCL